MRYVLAIVLALGACETEKRGPSKGPADVSQPSRVATTGTGAGAGATHHRDDGRVLAADVSQHAPESMTPRAMNELTGRSNAHVRPDD